jgi:hypothetical protein
LFRDRVSRHNGAVIAGVAVHVGFSSRKTAAMTGQPHSMIATGTISTQPLQVMG